MNKQRIRQPIVVLSACLTPSGSNSRRVSPKAKRRQIGPTAAPLFEAVSNGDWRTGASSFVQSLKNGEDDASPDHRRPSARPELQSLGG